MEMLLKGQVAMKNNNQLLLASNFAFFCADQQLITRHQHQ
jgi:hypothetical protein